MSRLTRAGLSGILTPTEASASVRTVTMDKDEQPKHLNERARRLLLALVESYIRDGQPVGSRTLTRESGLALSAATVRNVMADLEETGFVESPHTSAGRIPTARGYRFFVDAILTMDKAPHAVQALSGWVTERLAAQASEPKQLLAKASQTLSSLTQLAGVVTVPKVPAAAITQIEFLALSERRVLAVVVVGEREVENHILRVERDYRADELRRAAAFLNEQVRGLTLVEVRQNLLSQLQQTRQHMNQLMSEAIHMAEQVLTPPADKATFASDVMVSGETNLMGFSELSNVDKLKRLFDAFNEKRDILHLLDQCVGSAGVQIFIGRESGYQLLDDLSIVTAPYKVNEQVVGVLGVIGPTRMPYERVIPIVELTAKVLGSALNQVR